MIKRGTKTISFFSTEEIEALTEDILEHRGDHRLNGLLLDDITDGFSAELTFGLPAENHNDYVRDLHTTMRPAVLSELRRYAERRLRDDAKRVSALHGLAYVMQAHWL